MSDTETNTIGGNCSTCLTSSTDSDSTNNNNMSIISTTTEFSSDAIPAATTYPNTATAGDGISPTGPMTPSASLLLGGNTLFKKRGVSIFKSDEDLVPREAAPENLLTSKRKFNILCLDGGGMRGMVQCEMLKKLEQSSGKKIYELFDMIAGTSTGAILGSLMTAQRTADQASEMYRSLGQKIFGSTSFYKMVTMLTHDDKGLYNTKALEQAFREEYGGNLMLHPDYPNPRTKFLLLTAEVNKSDMFEAVIFRNYVSPYKDRGSQFKNVTMVEALRASTAAPFYLDAVDINGFRFMDGGVLHNNPTLQALMEARAVFGKDKQFTMINIGNGDPEIPGGKQSEPFHQRYSVELEAEAAPEVDGAKKDKKNKKKSKKNKQDEQKKKKKDKRKKPQAVVKKKLSQLLSVLTDSLRIAQEVEKYIATSCDDDQVVYQRFSPPNLGSIDTAQCDDETMKKMEQDTRRYIEEHSAEFEFMVKKLLANSNSDVTDRTSDSISVSMESVESKHLSIHSDLSESSDYSLDYEYSQTTTTVESISLTLTSPEMPVTMRRPRSRSAVNLSGVSLDRELNQMIHSVLDDCQTDRSGQ